MKPTLAWFLVFASALVAVAAADEPPKKPAVAQKPAQVQIPAAQATTIAPPPTGYDVAIVGLSSTGPEGDPRNALVVILENKGTQPLNHELHLQATANGQPTMLRSIHVRILPGARQRWTNDRAYEANIYPWGTVVWAKIDAQRDLREDNEQNNELSRTLKKLSMPHPTEAILR